MKTRQTFLTSTTFQNNQLIEHIDCNNVVWKGNSISYAFDGFVHNKRNNADIIVITCFFIIVQKLSLLLNFCLFFRR